MNTNARTAVIVGCAIALLATHQYIASADTGPAIVSIDRETLTPAQRAALVSTGIEGHRLDIQVGNGMTMVQDGDTWVIYQTSSSEISLMSFDVEVCEGHFFNIQKIAGKVEWAAQNSCQTLQPNSFYPHTITSTLRREHGLFNLLREPRATAASPSNSKYNLVVTAYGTKTCSNSNSRVYDQTVTVTVHGTQFGPKVSPDSTLSCEA